MPLFAAVLLIALRPTLAPRVAWLFSVLASTGAVAAAVSLAVYTRDDSIVVYWGGALVVDHAASLLVLLAAMVTTAVLIYSWRLYAGQSAALFPALQLMLLAAMCGVVETGNLLTLFLFFELMNIAAWALIVYWKEGPERAKARGFEKAGIAGGVLGLAGMALLFGRTGAWNLAAAGRALEGTADWLVVAAFLLLSASFLLRAGAAPFHFVVARAHATAPAPVAAVLSGVVASLGVFTFARVYWTVFSGGLGAHLEWIQAALTAIGVLSALSGAALAWMQEELPPMLSWSSMAHIGLVLMGLALMTPEATGGAALYMVGHALIRAGLFLAAGVLLYRTEGLVETEIQRRGRHLKWIGGLFLAGAMALAGAPPFATFWGNVLMDGAARNSGYVWLPWISFAASLLSAAALFRFFGSVFLGWGPARAIPGRRPPKREEKPRNPVRRHTPAALYGPAAALILLAALCGLAPRITGASVAAALHMQDRAAYAGRVLDLLSPYPPTVHDRPATPADLTRAAASILTAAAIAALALRVRRAR